MCACVFAGGSSVESDNNVKLIVLDRLTALKDVRGQERVMQVIGKGWGWG